METSKTESLLEAGRKVREQPSTETTGDGVGNGHRKATKSLMLILQRCMSGLRFIDIISGTLTAFLQSCRGTVGLSPSWRGTRWRERRGRGREPSVGSLDSAVSLHTLGHNLLRLSPCQPFGSIIAGFSRQNSRLSWRLDCRSFMKPQTAGTHSGILLIKTRMRATSPMHVCFYFSWSVFIIYVSTENRSPLFWEECWLVLYKLILPS